MGLYDGKNLYINRYGMIVMKEEPMPFPPTEHDSDYCPALGRDIDPIQKTTKPEMRSFEGGATRNTDAGKIDYEGFLSPFALKAYCEHLDSHRLQADGKMRGSDNWQSGFGPGVCMKSLLRHVWDAWMIGRGGYVTEDGKQVTKKAALCAAAFNIFSQLHDMEKPEAEPVFDTMTLHTSAEFDAWRDDSLPPCGGQAPMKCVPCEVSCKHHPDHKGGAS
jgi:hypothetical protein